MQLGKPVMYGVSKELIGQAISIPEGFRYGGQLGDEFSVAIEYDFCLRTLRPRFD